MNRIVFIAGGLTQPRVIKRINSFVQVGYEVKVFGFDRSTFQNVNILDSTIDVTCLGKLKNESNYIKSFWINWRKLRPIIKKESTNEVVAFYCFGFVPTLITLVSTSKKVVYEISDIIYGYFRNKFLRRCFRLIDRLLINKTFFTVLTSQGFLEYLFPKNENKSRIIIQSNKLDSSFVKIKRPIRYLSQDSIIKFSFIGFLRYPNTIFRFAEIVGMFFPRYEFHFYGDSEYRNMAKSLSSKYKNVFYYGAFKNPEDLSRIYNSIDVVVACYDTSTFNEKIAEPNKLYESIFFNKPIVVSNDTFLAKQVMRYNCGYILDASDESKIKSFIQSLDYISINKCIDNLSVIPSHFIIDNPNNILKEFDVN